MSTELVSGSDLVPISVADNYQEVTSNVGNRTTSNVLLDETVEIAGSVTDVNGKTYQATITIKSSAILNVDPSADAPKSGIGANSSDTYTVTISKN